MCIRDSFLNLYVGTTPNQSKVNFIAWLDAIVLGVSARVRKGEDNGTAIEAAYEGMNYSDVQKILSALETFNTWRQECQTRNINARKNLVITGNESNMTFTQHHIGPFC